MRYADDYHYAHTRLQDSLVRYAGTIVRVIGVGERGITRFRYIKDNSEDEVHLDLLDTSPMPLGYVNGGRPTYLTRIPKRRDWRQGLRENTMSFNVFDTHGVEAFIKTVNGVYPTFEEVVEERLGAWCREWALIGSAVHYKGRAVGRLVDGEIKLLEDFRYLSEALEEVL